MVRVLICNRIHLYAEGLARLLEGDEDIRVAGIACNTGELQALDALEVDLVLSDKANFHLLASQGKRILLINDGRQQLLPFDDLKVMVTQGLAGILDCEIDSSVLKKAIERVCSGELWLDRKIISNTLRLTDDSGEAIRLSRRESEILRHICDGNSNKEIAELLCISEQTVKTHCKHLFKKFDVSSRLQLALRATP